MKRITLTLAAAIMVAGAIFTGCGSADRKDDTTEAKADSLRDENAVRVATAEEYKVYKEEIELKIAQNDDKIAKLKAKKQKPGAALDSVYQHRIDVTEQQNRDLRAKLYGYEKAQSDWESFKREMNHDADAITNALDALVTDDKK